jgi:hypothetical protein
MCFPFPPLWTTFNAWMNQRRWETKRKEMNKSMAMGIPRSNLCFLYSSRSKLHGDKLHERERETIDTATQEQVGELTRYMMCSVKHIHIHNNISHVHVRHDTTTKSCFRFRTELHKIFIQKFKAFPSDLLPFGHFKHRVRAHLRPL